MIDVFFPMRMAQAATEMAFRNANAAMSMWGEAASAAARPAVAVGSSTRTVRSWYRHPDEPVSPFAMMSPAALMQPWIDLMSRSVPAGSCMMPPMGTGFAAGPQVWQAPMQAWMRMWSMMPTGMQAGPLAFALMAFGMPRSAAWPAAEAGAHAMEASRKAAEGIEQMFSTYRSDGGHAIAQIIFAGRRPR